jgi:penicillin G amidase
MKCLKKTSLFLLIFVATLVVAIFVYLQLSKPKYDGELSLKNIKTETTVYFDNFGVPHIYANSQADALVALGYVHAQDRLWQMELLRRIAPGQLSEIFGGKALKSDLFFAGLGIDEASAAAIKKLDKSCESYKLALAYLDGINQYIEEGKTPIEFRLLGLKKTKFELKDVYNTFGFMAFSFAMAQKTDPLLTDIRDQYGMTYLKDFGINGEYGTTQLKNFDGKTKDFAEISRAVSTLLDNSEVPPFIGSNSWIIGGAKTKTGKVILANDPHIGFSQPSTWYEAHISTPDYEMYGYHLAGTPFPLLGHNRQYGYGITMFENDDIDLYEETNNPLNANEYASTKGFVKYEKRKKIIKVKDSAAVVLNLKISRHGVIVNDILVKNIELKSGLKQKKLIAMQWIYTQQPIKILDATYALCHAKNLDNFKENIPLIAAPGLNIMYGDAAGNIAWTTSGKLYKHQPNVNTNFILDGASGKDDITEFLHSSKNPQSVNPPNNFLYSSNNQTEAVDGFLYPGYYLPKDRADRIVSLLTPKNDWTKESVSEMLLDNTSSSAELIVKNLLLNIDYSKLNTNEKSSYTILKNWKSANNQQEVAPTIYNKWIYNYLKNTFKDELGEENFKIFLTTHIMKQVIENQITNQNSPWWDNISTNKLKETQLEILTKSFKESIVELEKQLGNDVKTWTWNRVHTLEIQHPMGKISALRSFFNVGPFSVNGSNEVINNMMFTPNENGENKVIGGPSTRRIIDFSDIENSLSILPTGQSGNPMSSHYDDQNKMFLEGKFRKMMMNKKEIISKSTKLVFKPK